MFIFIFSLYFKSEFFSKQIKIVNLGVCTDAYGVSKDVLRVHPLKDLFSYPTK